MTAEAEISTPVEAVAEETSTITEPVDTETPVVEPNVTEETAEVQAEVTENGEEPPKVYAGKYNSVEELEKGYTELQKLMSKPNEYEQKYNNLLKAQRDAEEKAQQERLRQANQYGFRTVEDQEAHEKLQATELEWYANYLNLVAPENYDTAREYLGNYLRTGQLAYLNEAKKLYPVDFVENVRDAKTHLGAQLQNEIAQKRQAERDEFDRNLAEQIKGEFSEFLADISTNTVKASALQAMCNAGAISSLEDMRNFQSLFTSIENNAKELAIKEYEAAKAIEETKQKAVINSLSANGGISGGLKSSYTPEEIGAMSQEEYNALTDKYGEREIFKRIK